MIAYDLTRAPLAALAALRDDLGVSGVVARLAAHEADATAVARGRLELAPTHAHAQLASALLRLASALADVRGDVPSADRCAWADAQLADLLPAHGPLGVVELLVALELNDVVRAPSLVARGAASTRAATLRTFLAQADRLAFITPRRRSPSAAPGDGAR